MDDIPEIGTDELIRWLEAKYSRHGEVEDGVAAKRLKSLSSKLHQRDREIEEKDVRLLGLIRERDDALLRLEQFRSLMLDGEAEKAYELVVEKAECGDGCPGCPACWASDMLAQVGD